MTENDPNAGKGGSYSVDPETGVRTLIIPATAPSTPCAIAAAEAAKAMAAAADADVKPAKTKAKVIDAAPYP